VLLLETRNITSIVKRAVVKDKVIIIWLFWRFRV